MLTFSRLTSSRVCVFNLEVALGFARLLRRVSRPLNKIQLAFSSVMSTAESHLTEDIVQVSKRRLA